MEISSEIFCNKSTFSSNKWTKNLSKVIPRSLIEKTLNPARWTQSKISFPSQETAHLSSALTTQPKSLLKRSSSLNLSPGAMKALGTIALAAASIGTYFLLSNTKALSLPIQPTSPWNEKTGFSSWPTSSWNDKPTTAASSSFVHFENIQSAPPLFPSPTSPWEAKPAASASSSLAHFENILSVPPLSPLPTSPWNGKQAESVSPVPLSALDQCSASEDTQSPPLAVPVENFFSAFLSRVSIPMSTAANSNPVLNNSIPKIASLSSISSALGDFLWKKPKNFIWISFYEYGYNLFYSTPNASKLEERGRQLLEIFRIDLPSNADFKNHPKDLSYRKSFMDTSQCPVGLEDYISYQIENGYFNNLSPDVLKDLFGDQTDLTDAEARALYHLIDKQGISHMDRLLNERDLKKALIASLIRTNALEHTRSRMQDQDNAKNLYKRDKIVYGTDMRNLFYFLGKCGNATNEIAIAECLKRSATKTNAIVDLINLNLFSKITSSFYNVIPKVPSIFKLDNPSSSTGIVKKIDRPTTPFQFGTPIENLPQNKPAALGKNWCLSKAPIRK